jgi:Na+/proline symporter
MRKIADIAAHCFIFAVVLLSIVSILGIWSVFAKDVITKSFETIGLLAFVALVVIAADHFIDRHDGVDNAAVDAASVATFKSVRTITATVFISSTVLLALIGILSIWEVLSGDALHKTIASICLIIFSSLVVVVTCLEREHNPTLYGKKISGGLIVLIIVLAWIFIPMILGLMSYGW